MLSNILFLIIINKSGLKHAIRHKNDAYIGESPYLCNVKTERTQDNEF